MTQSPGNLAGSKDSDNSTTGYPPTHHDLSPDESTILHRAVGGSALGNAVEWFDYAVYGYLAVYIAANVFPS